MKSEYDVELMDSSGFGFHNAVDFAKRYGVSPDEVLFALNNGSALSNAKTTTHVYKYRKAPLFANGKLLNPGARLGTAKIKNVDTGIYYQNGADAAKKLGCSRALVSMCLAGKRKTCKGFRLKKVK